jgi:hypothetical protein
VDGKRAGIWRPLSRQNTTWFDQQLQLTPTLTRGKRSIAVKNEFVSSDLDFNEFYYAAHCQSKRSMEWALTDLLNVGWNNEHDEAYHDYQISDQTWEGLRYKYTYGGQRETHALSSIEALNEIYITLEFDEHQTVHQPLGSFFGVSLGKFDVRTLLLSVDSFVADGAFTSWFPMPFSKFFRMSLTRNSQTVDGMASVKWHRDESLKTSTDWGYFSTQHRRADTKTGKLWPFLSVGGAGVAYGVTHAMRGSILPPNNTLEFLEGDFQTWYNRTKPGPFKDAALLGTGTEDFYESGWSVPRPYTRTAIPLTRPQVFR